jgi:predicted unusual protein kinase regulating ubiquinone biosynthesis (AarF/ABC1/UbiB family)
VESDLRQLRLALAVYRRMDSTIQQDDVYAELAERLREELDYTREAAQMRLYHAMMIATPTVHIPEPVEPYCTNRLLTMTWLDGRPLLARLAEDPSQDERNRIAEALFRAYYVPFYQYGVIHGDPHLGNYQVRPDGTINLLDFGALRVFPPRFVRGVIDLFEAMRDHDDQRARAAYQTWGFGEISPDKLTVLNQWAGFLYDPLLDDRVRRIQENDDPMYGRAVLTEVHAGLKRTGGIRPPREFVLLDRSAIGLGSVFVRLRAELNWSALMREITADFSERALAERQAAALAAARMPTTP